MGGHAYWYVVPYQADIDAALQALRQREFSAGRYNPVIAMPPFPVTGTSPAPGSQHPTIQEAFDDADADGTRSILDIERIGDEPDFGVAARLSDAELMSLYGTTQPTRAQVEDLEFLEGVERGHAIYLVLHRDGRPDEILFAGYSFD